MEAGLSQEALSAKLQIAGWDISRGGLSKIEAGLRRVNDAELLVLSIALGCLADGLIPPKYRGKPSLLKGFLRQGKTDV